MVAKNVWTILVKLINAFLFYKVVKCPPNIMGSVYNKPLKIHTNLNLKKKNIHAFKAII